ncbi:unnamed protein product, partial [Rhizoctonia solani]
MDNLKIRMKQGFCRIYWSILATSLGGVESLIERRCRSDSQQDDCLLRLNISLEGVEDLKEDLRQGLNKVTEKIKVGTISENWVSLLCMHRREAWGP